MKGQEEGLDKRDPALSGIESTRTHHKALKKKQKVKCRHPASLHTFLGGNQDLGSESGQRRDQSGDVTGGSLIKLNAK